jgi:hypothetical protein
MKSGWPFRPGWAHNESMTLRFIPSVVWLSGLSLLCAGLLPCFSAAAGPAGPRLDVLLWFDTEDYLLPASDDAAKRLAELLTERGLRATFKVVGEKARTLARRGRADVIAALRKHAVAYHTDFHSVHPTPTEYLAECGLLDGVAEFTRREAQGAADVRRIFGVKTLACYGQPGSSWAPQAVAALGPIGVAPGGVPCYVDEGSHVGLNQRPFWYAGALNVYNMGANCTRMELHDPAALGPATKKVSAIADRLRREGGGLISIYYHPCEWVHREFWDGVNFARGRNPPREEWQQPRQRPAEETDAVFRRFAEYIDHIRAIPGVRFVTASDLPAIYPDLLRTQGVTEQELDELAQRIVSSGTNGLDFQVIGRKAFSVADQLELLTLAVSAWADSGRVGFPLVAKGLLGPDNAPPASRDALQLSWPVFRDALRDTRDFVRRERRVPARVFVGADTVLPGDFLLGLASVWEYRRKNGTAPPQEGVALGNGVALLPARHIAQDTPGLFGGWVIHREGFRAPKILEVARLQAWTLKPALRRD